MYGKGNLVKIVVAQVFWLFCLTLWCGHHNSVAFILLHQPHHGTGTETGTGIEKPGESEAEEPGTTMTVATSTITHTLTRYKKEHSIDLQHFIQHPGEAASGGRQIWNWATRGATVITDEYIRLTDNQENVDASGHGNGPVDNFGRLWNTLPLGMRNWEVEFKFRIRGKDFLVNANEKPKNSKPVKGLIFWYLRDPSRMTLEEFHGLSIIIETHPWTNNHTFPQATQNYVYIYALVRGEALQIDGDETHRFDGCFMEKGRNSETVTMLKIRYENNFITVWTNTADAHKWDLCLKFKMSLPLYYHLGFSSYPSDSSESPDILDIISVSTWKITKVKGITLQDAPHLFENDTRIFVDPRHQELQASTFSRKTGKTVNSDSSQVEAEEMGDFPSKGLIVPLIIMISLVIFCLFGWLMTFRDKFEPEL